MSGCLTCHWVGRLCISFTARLQEALKQVQKATSNCPGTYWGGQVQSCRVELAQWGLRAACHHRLVLSNAAWVRNKGGPCSPITRAEVEQKVRVTSQNNKNGFGGQEWRLVWATSHRFCVQLPTCVTFTRNKYHNKGLKGVQWRISLRVCKSQPRKVFHTCRPLHWGTANPRTKERRERQQLVPDEDPRCRSSSCISPLCETKCLQGARNFTP